MTQTKHFVYADRPRTAHPVHYQIVSRFQHTPYANRMRERFVNDEQPLVTHVI